MIINEISETTKISNQTTNRQMLKISIKCHGNNIRSLNTHFRNKILMQIYSRNIGEKSKIQT